MKLFFLCKRRPQGKDLIERPYGRFYSLPKILAEKGHGVHILLLSYKNEPKISHRKEGLNWTSISLTKHGPFAYIREAQKIIKHVKPDWVVGFSDTYYGILAQRLGTKFNIPSLIDAYDNYESYIPWLKPLHGLWRRSVSRATLATAAGPSLVDLLGRFRPDKPTEIIPMTADPIFKPMDKIECRQKLGLPVDKKIIGYSGSTIHASRGIDILFTAFDSLKQEAPDVELVLTGRKGRNITIPSEANWLGYIPDADMPLLLNSLDVLLVINKPSSFGNYSYPVKLYEAMCCQVPVVVSETLSTKWIMQNHENLLVEPGSAEKLSDTIKYAMDLERVNYGEQLDWNIVGADFELLLKRTH
jgi:glycosyltransferase involved in cell wall biosynthesis